MLTMQVVKFTTKSTKCEYCYNDLEGICIAHWDLVAKSLDTQEVEVYPYHESCFYKKLEILRRFDLQAVEFTFEQVKNFADEMRIRSEASQKARMQKLIHGMYENIATIDQRTKNRYGSIGP